MKAITRIVGAIGTGVVAVALAAMPAAAVVGGTQDTGNQFSNVGLVYIDGAPECTGTLYNNPADPGVRRYVMTAAHCVFGFGSSQYTVSFAEDGFSGPYLTGTGYYNQGYSGIPKNVNTSPFPDAAVIVLDQDAPANLPMATLPSVGQVDTLPAKQLLTTTGFGATGFNNANHPVYGARFYADETVVPGQRGPVADQDIKVSSATCFGDSGGPNFIKGTQTIVASTSWGNSYVCSSNSYVYRLDNVSALNFLEHPTTAGVHQ